MHNHLNRVGFVRWNDIYIPSVNKPKHVNKYIDLTSHSMAFGYKNNFYAIVYKKQNVYRIYTRHGKEVETIKLKSTKKNDN